MEKYRIVCYNPNLDNTNGFSYERGVFHKNTEEGFHKHMPYLSLASKTSIKMYLLVSLLLTNQTPDHRMWVIQRLGNQLGVYI